MQSSPKFSKGQIVSLRGSKIDDLEIVDMYYKSYDKISKDFGLEWEPVWMYVFKETCLEAREDQLQ